MKRKPPVPRTAKEPPKPVTRPEVQAPPWADTAMVAIFSLLLLLAMTVQTGRMSVVFCFLALVLSLPIGRAPIRNFRRRLCVPALGLLVFALMQGLAAIYSDFGEYAVREYYKFLPAFALAVILLARFEKKHVRGLLWGFAAVSAVIALVSVDAVGSTALFNGFNALVEALGGSFSQVEQYEGAARVAGIYNDANITASLFALGSLISLYFLHTEAGRKGKIPAALLLGVSAMGFFMALSRAAILCFGLALIVWLAAEGKGKRLPLFLRMLYSAGVVMGLSVFAMRAMDTGSPRPTLLTVLAGVPILLLDGLLTARLSGFLGRSRKWLLAGGAVVGAAAVCFAAAALKVTGPYTFDETMGFTRAVDLPLGSYTLSGDWDGGEETGVRVYAQSPDQALLSDSTVLYHGPLSEVDFTVSDPEAMTYFRFWGPVGAEVREVKLSDGTELPLRYRLLPSVLADRLQGGLFNSNSFLLRAQFMKDAWTLFTQSPLIGHGLGSTEGLYTSVQPFFYESKFVHSHVLQYLSDTGLLGTAAFLLFALGGLWLLLRALRRERDALAAVLTACCVMAHAHGLMEINFSVRGYLCFALCLLALPIVLYGEPISQKAAKAGGVALAACVWVYLAVFGGLLMSKRGVDREVETFSAGSTGAFLQQLESWASRDVFDREAFQLTYVANAAASGNPVYNHAMAEYVEALRNSGTYTACSGLAQYYYLPRGEWEELFACSREGVAQEASVKDVWNVELDFYREGVLPAMTAGDMDVYVEGVLALEDYLTAFSEGRLEEIELTETNRIFLDTVRTLAVQASGPEQLYEQLCAAFVPVEETAG